MRWMGIFLGLSFGNLLVTSAITNPSRTSYVLSLVFTGLAFAAWLIHMIRSRKDSPVSLEDGDKPEFILWRGGLYMRAGERANNQTSKAEEQGVRQ